MKFIPKDQFLAWASDGGITPDPKYEEPKCLVFAERHTVTIRMPSSRQKLAILIGRLVNRLFDDIDSLWVWKRVPIWKLEGNFDMDGRVRSFIKMLEVCGFNGNGEGGLRFEPSDRPILQALISLLVNFAWNVNHDLFVINEDRSFLLYFDHHDLIFVESKNAEIAEEVSSRLEKLKIATEAG